MIGRIAKLAFWIAGALTLLMMVIIVAEVIARELLGFSFLIVDEFAGYLLAAMVFLGLGQTLRDDSLLKIEVVHARITGRARLWYGLLLDAIALSVSLILLFYISKLVISSYERGIHSATVFAIPQYLPQLVLPIGCAVMSLCLLARIAATATALREGPKDDDHGI